MDPLRTLLAGAIDYAGLFPPAGLDMGTAVANYAEYRAGADAWALGRFVVPVARLEEFEAAAEPHLPRRPGEGWLLTALAGPDLAADVKAIGEFNCRHAAEGAGAAVIDAVEWKAASADVIEAALPRLPRWLTPYVELPLDDPAPLVDAVGRHRGRAKVRTGGVTPDAFPQPDALARFLARCARRRVPFKATAGLHHPLRGEYRLTYADGSPCGTMYGFLNLLFATAVLRAGGDEVAASGVLQERSVEALSVQGDVVAWRGRRFELAELAALRRDGFVAFGSCSFREPLDDLITLNLLRTPS